VTRRLKFLVAVRPGLHQPALAARMAATSTASRAGAADQPGHRWRPGRAGRRWRVPDHAERYEQSAEFIRIWREILARSHGDQTFDLRQAPAREGRACCSRCSSHPPVYFGGSSEAAHELAAEQVDTYLTWGEPRPKWPRRWPTRARAARHGRK
jgi:alkanesulfonate monooxygenase